MIGSQCNKLDIKNIFTLYMLLSDTGNSVVIFQYRNFFFSEQMKTCSHNLSEDFE